MRNMMDRERRAIDLLGSYSAKTAGGIMLPQVRQVLDGWIYANSSAILFLADAPLVVLPQNFPGLMDAFTVLLPIEQRPPFTLTAPMLVPNGIIAFADGVQLVGAKKRIKAIAELIRG